MLIEVLIHEDQAMESVAKGLDPYEYLVQRFQTDHGLTFTTKEILDTKKFTYEESTDGDWFKITFNPAEV